MVTRIQWVEKHTPIVYVVLFEFWFPQGNFVLVEKFKRGEKIRYAI